MRQHTDWNLTLNNAFSDAKNNPFSIPYESRLLQLRSFVQGTFRVDQRLFMNRAKFLQRGHTREPANHCLR